MLSVAGVEIFQRCGRDAEHKLQFALGEVLHESTNVDGLISEACAPNT
jgi:hypothetical protein